MLKILICSAAMAVASLVMTTTVSAAESQQCAAVADPAERLACYDAAFPPLSGAASLEATREKDLKNFGLNQVQQRASVPENQRVALPDRIEAAVTAVRTLAEGARTVTLENGQVWLLPEVTSKGHLEAGDHVVIRKAAIGTFMLITPGRIALRAKRLQ